MNLSRPFILRPVATSLLMVGLLLAGLVAYGQLPVSALPQVDYPTIQVMTFYPGASPDVMASSVTAPLERQFGEVPGLTQMTSNSSFGSSVITLQFDLNLNIDVAEQEVQAAINAAATYLPTDLPNPPVYSKTNPADAPILTLALTSKELQLDQVEDLADTRLGEKISQLPGVGLVSIGGGQKPSVRVQANPTALASYGMTLEDLRTAIANANVDEAKGNFDGKQQAYTIGANDQLLTAKDYMPLVVAYHSGAPVKLSDVAVAIDDAENVKAAAWMNLTPAVIVNVQRQPGANIIAVVDRIKALIPRLQASLPSSVKVQILTDGAKVRSEGPRDKYSVSYRIKAPVKTSVDAKAENGGIEFTKLDGQLRFNTTNGGVELTDVAGDVKGETTNGGLDIKLSGRRWVGAGLNAQTTNGGVELALPKDYGAHLEASTVNGGFEIEPAIVMQGKMKNSISGDIGGGGPTLKLDTVNGGVEVTTR